MKINSTCTVFAGAELRKGFRSGRSAMTSWRVCIGRSFCGRCHYWRVPGGISDEFTFTGGVARNPAAVAALRNLVQENYGERTLNISAESIYTGALGAALFAQRAADGNEGNAAENLARIFAVTRASTSARAQ